MREPKNGSTSVRHIGETGDNANAHPPTLFATTGTKLDPFWPVASVQGTEALFRQFSTTLAESVCASVFQEFAFGNMGTAETAAEG